MARLFLLLAVFLQALAFSVPSHEERLTGQVLVDFVNSKQTLFKAELSKFTTEEMHMRAMKGEFAKFDRKSAPVAEEIQMDNSQIPASFDSRSVWPNCASIKKIWDQSNCGSCWAFSSTEVMSDRTCIASGKQILLSPADVLTCCTDCGSGCDGGNPQKSLAYWAKTGVVTGGDYGSSGNCKPYQFHPCGVHNGTNYGTCPSDYSTPQCLNQCQQGYTTPYQQDKHYGSYAYYVQRNAAAIQKEIMTYGPVNGCFDLYEDFYQYKSGIYVHTAGKYVGGHCVKTIGWGTENGTPYWLVANSWNSDWGENGYFRIIRGTNEVGFEEWISAGHPKN